ncbi:hypothetical protein ACHAXT_001242 [Thalassiosira profunda]
MPRTTRASAHRDDEGGTAHLKFEGTGDGSSGSLFASGAVAGMMPASSLHQDAQAAAMAAAALPDHHPGHAAGAVEGSADAALAAATAKAGEHGLSPAHEAAAEEMAQYVLPPPLQESCPPPKWMNRFEELKAFKERHGTFDVPPDYKHKQLSSWIRTQKQQSKYLREGKVSHLTPARIELLNSLGFPWAGERRDKFWRDRYAELAAFHAQTGTTRIPPSYAEAPQLHTWVSLQRRQLKLHGEGKPTKLTEERIQLLEAVGLETKIRSTTTWMDRFMELKRYKDEHGNCDIPQKWKENPSLGRWVDNQKTQHQKLYDGKPTHMTIERIQLLVSIGFNFRRK